MSANGSGKKDKDRQVVAGRMRVRLAETVQPHENAVHKEPADDPSVTRKSGTSTANLARIASGRRYLACGVSAEDSGVHAEYDGNGTRTGGDEPTPEPAESIRPIDATRELHTSSGTLTYTAVSERLAVNIVHCLDALFDADPAADEQGEVQRSAYFAALRRADAGDLSWLAEIWLHRLAA
jgi:hypothetical protein